MKMKGFFAWLLVCVTALLTLSACEQIDAKALETRAVLKLLESPYIMKMDMRMDYSSKDDEINDLLDGNGVGSSMSMNIDGKNFKVTAGSEDMGIEYTFADNVLYMEMMGSKIKTEMSEEDVGEMLGTNPSGIGNMSINMFSSVKAGKGDGGKVTVTCKGLKGESNELIDSLTQDIGKIGDGDEAVSLDKEKLEYVAVIDNNGRYETIKITIVMITDIEGERLTITSVIDVSFDYDNAVAVTSPSDADEYYDIGDIGGIFE